MFFGDDGRSNFVDFLCKTSTLRWSGALYALLSVGFLVVMWRWNFQVIDEVFLRDTLTKSLANLDATQKQVHVLVTATLDVAYPFAYGIFQAGMAYRFLGDWGKWLAPLSLVCIPVDLIEGFAQVMILKDHLHYVPLKVIVTPIKLLLYIPGLGAALVALGFAVSRASKTKQQ